MPTIDETMAFRELGTTMLCVHSDADPTPSAWNAYVDALAEAGLRTVPAPIRQILIFTRGGAPNSLQRRRLLRLLDHDGASTIPTALLSDSRIARGAATVIGWFGAAIKPFRSTDLDAAFDWLAVPQTDRADIQKALNEERSALETLRNG